MKKYISILVSLSIILNPLAIMASGITVDNSNAVHAPNIVNSGSGIKIIEIVKPNQQGLSHNKFKNFNVDKKGVILNNSNRPINTKLGGYIANNPNLQNGKEASVILNEVTGTKKSDILGYIEVAGKKADVIIANPNGIYVNGGGFINVGAATLTTGELKFKDGLLNGFDVSKGEIVIEGDGFGASSTDMANLYSKALILNGEIYANRLNIVTGGNVIDMNGNVFAKGERGSGFSLDSFALGGIYANVITLTSSDKGVGVNLPPIALAQDRLLLNANGEIILNELYSNNEIVVNAKDGDIEANNNIASNKITLSTNKNINIGESAILEGGDEITLNSNNLLNKGAIYTLNSNSSTNVNTVNNLINNGFLAGYNLNIFSNEITNSEDGAIYSRGNLYINANNLTNSDYLRSDGRATLHIKDTLLNDGAIFTVGDLSISKNKENEKTDNITNNNLIESYSNIIIFAKDLINFALSPDYTTVKNTTNERIYPSPRWDQFTYNNTQTNKSTDILIAANDPSMILAGGSMYLEVDNLKNEYSLIASDNDIILNAGEVKNIGKVAVSNTTTKIDIYKQVKKKRSKLGGHYNTAQLMGILTSTEVSEAPDLNFGIQARNSITGNVVKLYNTVYQLNPETQEEIENKLSLIDNLNDKNLEVQDSGSFFNELKEDIKNTEDGADFFDIKEFFTFEDEVSIDEIKDVVLTLKNSNQELVDNNLNSLNSLKLTLDELKTLNQYQNIEEIKSLENSIDELTSQINLANEQITKLQNIHDDIDSSNKDTKISEVLSTNDEFAGVIYGFLEKLEDESFLTNSAALSLIIADDAALVKADTDKLIEKHGSVDDIIITENEGAYKVGVSLNKSNNQGGTNNIVLPKGKHGEFIINTGNEALYLIESNPLYASFEGFIGSKYLQDKIGFDQEATYKRLGDAMYETKLIRESIIKQTGNRYLDGYYSDTEQFLALMNNALESHEELNLIYGVSLTYEQIANLDKDIIWMEKQTVSGYEVLVPVLYLTKNSISSSGPKLTAGSINLNVENEFINKGTIVSTGGIVLNAGSIKNIQGKISSKGDLVLIAKNDVENLGGDITSGKDMLIYSEDGSIISKSLVDDKTYLHKDGYQISSQVGKKSSLTSSNNMELVANKDVELLNTNAKAGNALVVQAEGDIVIGKQISTDEYSFTQKGSFYKGATLKNEGGSLEANNIILNAKNDLTIDSSKLTAISKNKNETSKDMNANIMLRAGNDVNILASNDVYHNDMQITSKDLLSKTTKRDMVHEEKTIQSELEATNIVIVSGNDVNLEAAKLVAQENIEVDAKNNINIIAKVKKDASLHMTKKSSWGGLSKSLDLVQSEAYTLSSAELETKALNIILTSGNDINIIASNIESASSLQLEALNNILIAAGEEAYAYKEVHEKTTFNLGNLITGLLSAGLIETGAIYTSEKSTDQTYDTKAKSSNIKANENIIIKSGETNIIGSNLDAGKNIAISADTGVINILAASEKNDAAHKYQKTEVTMGNTIDAIKSSIKSTTMGNTQLKITVASAEYDKNEQSSSSTNHISSNLNAEQGNIILNSLTDLTITGSNLQALEGAISLNSEVGDITINEAINTKTASEKDKHAEADLSITVQNEYAEIGSAIKSAVESAEQLKKVKDDYSNYKKEVKKLQSVVEDLKQRYKNKESGIEWEDIEDLEELIDNVKDTEKYYLASIAAATVDLATKTVAIATQIASAAASTGTWGFSVGLALDLSGSETKASSQATSSLGSNLFANDIYLSTNIEDELLTNVVISGSNLIANNNLFVQTGDLNIKSSLDTYKAKQESTDISTSLSMTMYGGGSGLGGSASYADSYKNEESLVNTNSNLIANNINLYVKNDATIKGATIRADDTLKMYVGGNLELISQRDELSSIQKGTSIGGEYSLGSDNKYTSGKKKGQRVLDKKVGARIGSSLGGGSTNTGNSKGTYQGKDVVLSSITGENVNIEVKGNTNLKGSLIAAGSYDEYGNFIDNNNLYLKTDTLTHSSLSSTLYSKDSSFGTGSNTGLIKFEGFKPVINGSKAIPSSMNLASSINYSKEKTLATIGSGTLIVNDEENSDELERLNRDTNNIIKDLYKGEIGTSVDASIDHRLLTSDGRAEIKKDIKISSVFIGTIKNVLTKESQGSSSFIRDNDFTLSSIEIAEDNPELFAKLDNPNISPDEKNQIITQITDLIYEKIGYEKVTVVVMNTDAPGNAGKKVLGYYDPATGTIFLNNGNIVNAADTIHTLGHEIGHNSAYQDSLNYGDDKALHEENANIVANIIKDAINFGLKNSGQKQLSTDAYTNSDVLTENIIKNNEFFKNLDKNEGFNNPGAAAVALAIAAGKTLSAEAAASAAASAAELFVLAVIINTISEIDFTRMFSISESAKVEIDMNNKKTLTGEKITLVDAGTPLSLVKDNSATNDLLRINEDSQDDFTITPQDPRKYPEKEPEKDPKGPNDDFIKMVATGAGTNAVVNLASSASRGNDPKTVAFDTVYGLSTGGIIGATGAYNGLLAFGVGLFTNVVFPAIGAMSENTEHYPAKQNIPNQDRFDLDKAEGKMKNGR